MNITDEVVMAYADGELDPEAAAAVANEIERNPELARKVEQHRALRKQFGAAFDPVLDEPIPARLTAVISEKPLATVTQLSQKKSSGTSQSFRESLKWLPIAASVAFGVLLGAFLFNDNRNGIVADTDGVPAQGNLARALTEELASRPTPDFPVRIGASYEANSGDYCRTFIVADKGNFAGLACHPKNSDRDAWRIRVLVPVESTSDANYRTAASAMPPAVLDQVNKEIKGEPFDAEQEARIVSRGWTSR